MRVVVIGAGLGGLSLAHRLVRAGVDVSVHERDPDVRARFQGYRIGVGGDGLTALQDCLPERLRPLLDAVGGELTGVGRVVDTQLAVLGELPVHHEGRLFDRYVLRSLLLADLGDRVVFGEHLLSYEELADGRVRAHFANGGIATADVLVGADGAGSTVRRQLLPELRMHLTGTAAAGGRVPLTERFAALVPGWSTVVNTPEFQVMLGKMPFQMPPEEAAARFAPDVWLPPTPRYLRWVLLIPAQRLAELDVPAEGSDIEPLLGLVDGWHPDLRAMFEETDRSNSGIGPMRTSDPLLPWPTRAVTLLGDAAHPAPPGGRGAYFAFTDAAALAGTLLRVARGDAQLLPALADYERELCARGTESLEEAAGTLRSFDELRRSATT